MYLRLDPWMASSLLQKAIRRGEAELAQYAASALHRYRGAAIWNRLVTIAVEDVGIADMDLVLEVTRFATDTGLRSVLASDSELIEDLAAKLAGAPKDRSADYLHSAAIWKTSTEKAGDLFAHEIDRQIVETGNEQPLVSEAVRLLRHCTTTRGTRTVIDECSADQLFNDGSYAPTTIIQELSSASPGDAPIPSRCCSCLSGPPCPKR